MSYFLKQFFSQDREIFATELGHSIIENAKAVGPWSRSIYILHLVVRGYCEFSGFKAEKGQAFFISKGLRHSFTTSDDYEHYWVGFDGDGVEALFKSFSLKSSPHQLFFVKNPDFAETLFSNACKALKSDDSRSPDLIALAALTAMLPLLEKHPEPHRKVNYAEKVQGFIQANYTHPIKMTDIASEIHITEKYMYRLFLNGFGISPQKFLLKTRMEAAKKLLSKTDLTVKEVASSVGYTSLPSFSKAFSNYFGISPGLLKKQKM